MAKLLTDKVKKLSASELSENRYDFLRLSEAEPDFGVPIANNGIMASLTDGTRKFLYFSDGLLVTGNNVTSDVTTTTIDTSTFSHSSANTLFTTLSDLDDAISSAVSGSLSAVSTDASISGSGTSGSPLSVVDDGHDHTTFLRNDANTAAAGIVTFENDIKFVSPDGTNTITVRMLDSDTLTFNGESGQLFSISDDLTGTIFSVNDITGIPLIEADADATIRLGETAGNILIGTATDDGINKLQVNGSVSISDTLSVADVSVSANATVSGSLTVDGDLTVSGTTTYIDTVTLNVGDNIITLNADETGAPTQDAGIEIERGTSNNVSLLWDETNDRWTTEGETFQVGSLNIEGYGAVINSSGEWVGDPDSVRGYTGSQGPIGYTGSQGVTGFTGSQGDIGYTGSQGDIGYTGSQGIQGVIGYTGSKGDQGDIGYTGSQGSIGYTGSQGAIGYTGSRGPIGYTGSQGIQGVIGYTGSQGIQGDIGYTGSQGDIGYTGSQGDQGVIGYTGSQGDQGVIGYTGSQGIQGVIGYTGSQGIQGVIGYTGSQGIQGVIGYTGSKGDIGYTGSQGDIGYTGSRGPIGYTGSKGDIGYTGSQGPIGYTGSKGDIGYTGSQGPVAGTDGQVVYNNGGVAGGANLYYDDVNDRVGVKTSSPSYDLDVTGTTNISGSLIVGGDLTVSGNTTVVNTTNLDVQDAVITLNTGQSTPSNDIGLLFQRYATANTTNYNVGIAWEEGNDNLIIGKTPEDGSDNDLSFSEEILRLEVGTTTGSKLVANRDIIQFGYNYNSGPKAIKFQRNENKAAIWSVPVGSYGRADIRFTTGDELIGTAKTESDAVIRIAPAGGLVVGNSYLAQNPADGNMIVSGNVGIGTTSPAESLHVTGHIRMVDDKYIKGDNGKIYLGEDSAAYYVMAGTNTFESKPVILGANPEIIFKTNTIERMRILTNGNVGIGNSAPSYKLDLGHSAGDTVRANEIRLSADTGGSTARIYGESFGDRKLVYHAGYHSFVVTSSQNEVVRITGDQNVGIGTSTPSAKLDVVGDIEVNSLFNINAETATLATVTQTAIATFAAATYSSGKFVVQATDSVTGEVHVSELLVVHDGTTASVTEYGLVYTGANPLATYDVDINSGNVRILATAASANSTTYKVIESLITA